MAVGISRFVIGLSKFLLLVGFLSPMIDTLLDGEITYLSGWIIAFAMALNVFFQLSGYTDMAIGLGHMLGYSFKENFNYPFVSSGARDFIKRWYATGTSWFFDYMYIPLKKNAFALLLTASCFGLWFGADWRYALVGLAFGIFVLLEKKWTPPAVIRRLYMFFLMLLGLVMFRAESLGQAIMVTKGMFNGGLGIPDSVIEIITPLNILVFAWALFFCVPHPKIKAIIKNHFVCTVIVTLFLLALCILRISMI